MSGFSKENLLKEVRYKAVLSGGPGGQHVNKTATKVELTWDLGQSEELSKEQKARLIENKSVKLSKDQVLKITSDATRSQHKNKHLVTEKFLRLVGRGVQKPKKRRQTKPTRASKLKRLRNKKINAEKKSSRQKPKL